MLPFKKNEKYAVIAWYVFLTLVGAAVFLLCVINFKTVFSTVHTILATLAPLTYGFVIAYLCCPVMSFYERTVFAFKKSKKNMSGPRRVLSLILTLLTVLAIIAVILYAIIPHAIQSFEDLGSQMEIYVRNIQSFADKMVGEYSDRLLGQHFDTFSSLLAEYDISLNLRDLVTRYYSLIGSSANYLISYGGALVGELKNFTLGLILAIYFLHSKELLLAQIKKILYAFTKRRTYLNVVRLARFTHETFGGFITGKLLDSLIIGLLSFLALWICRVPYSPLLSVIIGLTNIVPFFGPLVGAVICGLLILIAAPGKFIWVVVIIIVIQQLDGNVIGPKILGNSIGISSLWVILAITVAGGLFGFAGMVLGVPLTAVLYVLVKQYIEQRLRHKDLPMQTTFYMSDPPKEMDIDADTVFIDKNTDVPELTGADDVPPPAPRVKKSHTARLRKWLSDRKKNK